MATAEADAAVLALLDAITSPLSLDSGRNLFLGPMLDPSATRPNNSVCVLATGGALMARLVSSSQDWRTPTVQVTVRADRSDYDGGIALARACLSACQAPSSMPSGYTDCQVREADVTYIQRDAQGRHLWSFNVQLIRVG
jgi:hypothetical protein